MLDVITAEPAALLKIGLMTRESKAPELQGLVLPAGPEIAGPDSSAACSAKKFTSFLASRIVIAAVCGAMVIVAATIGAMTASAFGEAPDLSTLRALVLQRWWPNIMPEPIERAAYIGAVLAVFPLVLAGVHLHQRARQCLGPRGLAFFAALTATMTVLCFAESGFLQLIITGDSEGALRPSFILQVLMASAVASVFLWGSDIFKSDGWRVRRLSPRSMLLLSAPLVLLSALLRLRSAEMLFGDMHFEAVFYSVSQVAGGKTLLADLPVQYGLYAELLGPIFRSLGMSVIGFTLLLSALQATALFALIAFTTCVVRTPLLLVIALVTTFLVVGNTWMFIWQNPVRHEYYQLWPIRMLFPALILAAYSLAYRRGMQPVHILVLACIRGVGVIWNFDWGLPALGSLIVLFLVRWIFGAPSWRKRLDLLIILAIPPVLAALFAAYLTVKTNDPIIWTETFKYQAIFYGMGFGMLPLPLTPHPWMLVLAVYLYGLVFGVLAHARSKADIVSDAILVLSVMGIGIFTYYQGRSHDIVLSFVMWPAILIAFILADKTVRAVRLGLIPRSLTLPIMPIVALGLTATTATVLGIPHLVQVAAKTLGDLAVSKPTKRSEHVTFILERTVGAPRAGIFAPGQSILFAETSLGSDVAGPGDMELLLVEDLDRRVANLLSMPTQHLFIDFRGKTAIPDAYSPLLLRYRIIDRSPHGLVYLQPK
jgi:hypothetical protein